ncbi:hypothetical protein AAHA92_17958 [Salvia divinorum]|uniref:Uncharacterized protein n=1 Tax=Salvia divinorum TaxID=28513 RepID=A0ABD1H1R4_SALDI
MPALSSPRPHAATAPSSVTPLPEAAPFAALSSSQRGHCVACTEPRRRHSLLIATLLPLFVVSRPGRCRGASMPQPFQPDTRSSIVSRRGSCRRRESAGLGVSLGRDLQTAFIYTLCCLASFSETLIPPKGS